MISIEVGFLRMVAKGFAKSLKERENRGRISNYRDHMNITMISVVVGVLGMVTKGFEKTLEEL